MRKNHAISVYGSARKICEVKGYYRKKSKLVTRKGKTFRMRVGKPKFVRPHIRYTKDRQTRFTFYGTMGECKQAVEKMRREHWVPKKQYTDRVSAVDFLKNPNKYADRGEWNDEQERSS